MADDRGFMAKLPGYGEAAGLGNCFFSPVILLSVDHHRQVIINLVGRLVICFKLGVKWKTHIKYTTRACHN